MARARQTSATQKLFTNEALMTMFGAGPKFEQQTPFWPRPETVFTPIPIEQPVANAPVGVPPDVSVALASVPIAQDGFVIDADYHNSLRDALISVANYVGEGALSQTMVKTLAPALLPYGGATAWNVLPEHAEGIDGASGWLPVDLPDGARLQALGVSHTSKTTLEQLLVSLERTSVKDSSMARLFSVKRDSGDGSARIDTASLAVQGITSPGALDEFRRVDNANHRYFIRAFTEGTGQGAVAGGAKPAENTRIHALQVFFTR